MNITPSRIIATIVIIIAAAVFYLLCINHVPANSVGVAYDSWSGTITVQSQPGWHLTSPFVRVATLSTLVHSVHIPSAAKVINVKMVRLRPDKVEDFVRLQGFSYDLGTGLETLLMGYAFSGQSFSFLEIVQEGGLEQTH